MADGRIDEWFGRRVGVELTQLGEIESHRMSATLESADERGIVVSYQGESDPNTQHMFFPWQNIRFVYLSAEPQSTVAGGDSDEGRLLRVSSDSSPSRAIIWSGS